MARKTNPTTTMDRIMTMVPPITTTDPIMAMDPTMITVKRKWTTMATAKRRARRKVRTKSDYNCFGLSFAPFSMSLTRFFSLIIEQDPTIMVQAMAAVSIPLQAPHT